MDSRFSTNDKKPLLFLHGYLADKNSFVYQTPFFSKYFDVHAIDFKGFGENAGMDYPYALDDYVNDVKEYISKNGLIKPHIIAHSFGGRVAVKMLADNPNLADKLVLTGSAGLKPKRSVKYRLKKLAFNLTKKFLSNEQRLKFYSADYLALSPVMRESFKKIIAENLDGKLKDIKNKTLIIYGEKDAETPLYMARRFNRGIADSKLIIIKNGGHFCFIDSPYKFNLEVREFLLSK